MHLAVDEESSAFRNLAVLGHVAPQFQRVLHSFKQILNHVLDKLLKPNLTIEKVFFEDFGSKFSWI